MTNWKKIHEDFRENYIYNGKTLQGQWENSGFNYEQTRQWINLDLKPEEYEFAYWLVNEENQIPEFLNKNDIKKYRWQDIHKDFDWWIRKNWEENSFNRKTTKHWIDFGLIPAEYKLADYFRSKNYESSNIDIKELRSLQGYLNWLCISEEIDKRKLERITVEGPVLRLLESEEERKKEIELTEDQAKEINGGELDLTEYSNLNWVMIEGRILKSPLIKLELGQQKNLTCINCKDNKLTYLEISGCPNLHSLDCSNNQLTNLNLSKNESLEHLDIRNNNFREQDLSFLSYLTRLKKLELGNDDQERIEQNIYNHFLGSLKYLQNLDKLEELNISNSDIDSGLEFLADNIKKFNCSADKRSNSKVKVVIEKLKSFGGSEGWWNKNFALSLKKWKKWKLEHSRKQIEVQKQFEEFKIKVDEKNMIEDEKEVSNIADKVVLLDTSRQLETKDLNTENKTLKIENERLKRENHSLKLELRSFKLEQLVNQAKNKLNEEGRELLENMLQAQSELANNKDNSFAQKQLEKTKKILQKKLTEEEIQNIMDNHKEISKLEKEFGCLEVYENVIEIPPKNI